MAGEDGGSDREEEGGRGWPLRRDGVWYEKRREGYFLGEGGIEKRIRRASVGRREGSANSREEGGRARGPRTDYEGDRGGSMKRIMEGVGRGSRRE